jgi:apolipoprotein N-acyltransferase
LPKAPIAIHPSNPQRPSVQKLPALFGRHPRLVALSAGLLSATGFAPWGLWPLTLICFALFIMLVAKADSGRRALLIGWLFGIGHFTFSNQWIAVAFTFQAAMPIWLGYFAVVALALYLAVYPALTAWGAWWVATIVNRGEATKKHRSAEPVEARLEDERKTEAALRQVHGYGISFSLILAFAGLWIVTEWLRSWVFTGYVWNPLGVSLIETLVAQVIAPAFGTYALSGIVVFLSGALLSIADRIASGNFRKALFKSGSLVGVLFGAIFILPVLLAAFYPPVIDAVFGKKPAGPQTDINITVVQPNRPQMDKDDPAKQSLNFAKLAVNSRPLPGQGPRLLLWSEDAIPDYLEDGYPYRYYQFQPGESAEGARARLTTLMGEGDVLLTGATRLVVEKGQLVAARNSVSAMNAEGRLLGHYDKAHLVPYGEYLPMPWLLKPLGLARLVPGDLDFWPGPGPQTMTVAPGGTPVKVGMQICYEIIFSGQVVDRADRPDFIFNPSNDAWFGEIGPPQHLAQARLRAIEEGLPVVRATPTGISAVIDADGYIVESLPLGTAGRIDMRVPAAKAPTLFARLGNVVTLAFAALLIAAALLPLARRRSAR